MTLLARIFAAALCLASSSACAAKARPITGTVSVAPQGPDLSGVLALMGDGGMAQACPIAPDAALTNAHVVGKDYERFIWESRGRIGLLGAPSSTIKDRFRDLARVAPQDGTTFPHWYAVAKEAPKAGDKVRFRGWDFRKRRDAFAARDFDSVVLRVVNGHVIYHPPGVRGTSGSCVLNAGGEVVAVNAFGHSTEDQSEVGGGVGVWGELLDLGQ